MAAPRLPTAISYSILSFDALIIVYKATSNIILSSLISNRIKIFLQADLASTKRAIEHDLIKGLTKGSCIVFTYWQTFTLWKNETIDYNSKVLCYPFLRQRKYDLFEPITIDSVNRKGNLKLICLVGTVKMTWSYIFLKMGQPRPLFSQTLQFYNNLMWIMSIQYPAPGFELTTF